MQGTTENGVQSKGPEKRTLDCGHHPSPHDPNTTGTAWLRQPGKPDVEICWKCAEAHDHHIIRNERKTMGYLARCAGADWITNWPGAKLFKVTSLTHSRGAMTPYTFDAVAVIEGSLWYGRRTGYGMICTVWKRRGQSRRNGS